MFASHESIPALIEPATRATLSQFGLLQKGNDDAERQSLETAVYSLFYQVFGIGKQAQPFQSRRSIFDSVRRLGIKNDPFILAVLNGAFGTLDRWSNVHPFDRQNDHKKDLSVGRVPGNPSFILVGIKEFRAGIADQLSRQLRMRYGNRRFSGIIFDLRNNPGGDLREALRIASLFIPHEPFVSHEPLVKILTKNGLRDIHEEGDFPLGLNLSEFPVIVLVNENSGSSAEVFTGILQSYGKAIIMGELPLATHGKGIAQKEIHFYDYRVTLEVSIGRIFLPDGSCFNEVGLMPDISIEDPRVGDPCDGDPRVGDPREEGEGRGNPEEANDQRGIGVMLPDGFGDCRSEETRVESFFNDSEKRDLKKIIKHLKTIPKPKVACPKEENHLMNYAKALLEAWMSY